MLKYAGHASALCAKSVSDNILCPCLMDEGP